jgi:hypothetical protein
MGHTKIIFYKKDWGSQFVLTWSQSRLLILTVQTKTLSRKFKNLVLTVSITLKSQFLSRSGSKLSILTIEKALLNRFQKLISILISISMNSQDPQA